MAVGKVLVGGVFDILHFGHIKFLVEARKLGDELICAIESDANVKRLKGSNRPIHSQEQRKKILLSLRFVDQVIILKNKMIDKDYEDLVMKIKPAVIATTEGDPILDKKRVYAEKVGAKLVEIPKIKTSSTTQIAKLLKIE